MFFKFQGPDVGDEPRPKRSKPRPLPVILTVDEVDYLLTAALASVNNARTDGVRFRSWRDFSMVSTGLNCGPRISELCALEVTDVDLAGSVLHIRKGKGEKDRNIPINAKLSIVLREWIGKRRTGWLFSGPHGKQFRPRAFHYRLVKLAKAAKIVKNVHPHLLRHSFATMLLDKNVNLLVIQQLLGHANVSTTQIYAKVSVENLKAAVDLL